VNHRWLKETSLSPWRSQYSVSDEIEDLTDKELSKVIHSIPNKPPVNEVVKTPEEFIQTIHYLWSHSKPATEEDFIHIYLRELLLAFSREDQAKMLGQFCRSRISTILTIFGEEETDPPYQVRASIVPGGLALPSSYYLDTSLHSSDVWLSYIKFIEVCALELNSPLLLNAITAETEVAKILESDSNTFQKRVKGKQLHSILPDFSWNSFMEGWGFDSKWTTRFWLVDSFERTRKLLHWYATANPELPTALLSFHLLVTAAPYLSNKIRDAYQHLFYTVLKGSKELPSKEIQCLNVIKELVPESLSKLYAHSQEKKRSLNDLKHLVQHIKDSAINIIDHTTLFRKQTASAVKEKIRRMKFELGSTTTFPLPTIQFGTESFLDAMFKIQESNSKQLYFLLGKPSFSDKREMYACYDANASYFSESNHIVIPWGILQWPFYCEKAPVGWNYGGIGATLGHEMTHAFDLEGSQYNPNAVYKEWWTRKNRNQFKKRTRKVSKIFSKIQHYGLHVDGQRTLSENWADLGGVTIALNALKFHLHKSEATCEQKTEALRNFFIAYAVSWRAITRKEQMIYSIQTSVHAPSEDRVDAIVSQFQDFFDVFDIEKTDKLYTPPSSRLKFF
jgi:predicted metalloendopeptidase